MPKTDGKTEQRSLLGIEDVAELLGVGVRHVRRLVAERRIPYLKWGHLLRFDPAESTAGSTGFAGRPGPTTRSPCPGDRSVADSGATGPTTPLKLS